MKTILKTGVGNLEGIFIKPGVSGFITFFDGETELCTLNLDAANTAIAEKVADLQTRAPEEATKLTNEGEWNVLNEPFETELSVEGNIDLITPVIV